MVDTRAYATDAAATGAVHVDTGGAEDFGWNEVEIVEIDHSPHETAFDTEKFYKIGMTVARPVEQTYNHADGSMTAVKPAEELRDAAWSVDNAPITLGHPNSRIVDSADLIHGFVRNAIWDEDDQSLKADAYIPVTDMTARSWVEANDGVSIGFWHQSEPAAADGIDEFQRNLYVDHVALVDEGRCSREQGCGLGMDGASMGTAIRGFVADLGHNGCSDGACSCGLHRDSSRSLCELDATVECDSTYSSEHHHYDSEAKAREAAERIGCEGFHTHADDEGNVEYYMPCESHEAFEEQVDAMTEDATQGDWVQWEDGAAHGKVIGRKTEGCFSDRIDGDHEICADEDDPVVLIEHYDSETGESTDTNVAHKVSTVNSWSGPGNDSAYSHDDASDVDLSIPEAVQNAAQQALDARSDEDVTVNGMTDRGWRRAETLADGGSLSPDDIIGGQDGMANWWSRHADDMIDTSGDSLSLHAADDDNPWSNNSYTAAKGWGGVAGYRFAIQKGNEIKRARDEDPDYSRLGNDRPTEDRHWSNQSKISFDHQMDSSGVNVNMATAPAPYYIVVHDEGNEHVRQNAEIGGQLGREGPFDSHEDTENIRVEFDQEITEARRVYAVLYYSNEAEELAEPIESQQGFIFDSAVVIPDENSGRSLRRTLRDAAIDVESIDIDEVEMTVDNSRTVAGVTFSGVKSGTLEESEIPTDGFESHYLYPGDTKSDSSYDVVDADGNLRQGNVESAHSLGARGGVDDAEHRRNIERLNEVLCESDVGCAVDPETFEEDTTMSTDTDTDTDSGGGFAVDSLTLDAIVEQNDEVQAVVDERNELEDEVQVLNDRLDELEEEVESYRADEKQEIVDEITSLTDAWSEDELLEADLDTVETRLELAKDVAAEVDTGPETDVEVEADTAASSSQYERGEVYDLSETA